MTREAPHKQNYDQGGSHKQNYDQGAYPRSELRPGSWLAELRPGNLSCAWLAGWLAGGLAGWLAEAQRGPEKPTEAERG